MPSIGPEQLTSAQYHLALADTAGAEARLMEINGILEAHRYEHNFDLRFGNPHPWMGRAWLLGGDVAAARGRPAEAARLYRRVIELWGGGDADLQPVVDGARERLRALPGR